MMPEQKPHTLAGNAHDPISFEQIEQLWEELAALAQSIRRQRNQHGQSYPTSDVLVSALRRLAIDHAKRLREGAELTWETRDRFFAAAATAMHRALVDHIRTNRAAKRDSGKFKRLPLDDAMLLAREDPAQLLALHECLGRQRDFNPELAELVERKIFLPMSETELAEMYSVTQQAINYRWKKALAYLVKCMGQNNDDKPK